MNQTLLDLRFFGEGTQAAEGAPPEAETSGTEKTAEPSEAAREETKAGEPAETDKPAPRPEEAGRTEEADEADEVDFRSVLAKAALAARVKAAQAAAARWEKEAEDLKRIYPFFSLEQSMRTDKGFVSLLKAGVSVRLAFEAANLDKILGAAMRYAAGTAGKRTVQSILAGAGRVRENPVLDRASSVRKKDVGSLTEREIMKILHQVSNGERITF